MYCQADRKVMKMKRDRRKTGPPRSALEELFYEWELLANEFRHSEYDLRCLADAADVQAIVRLAEPPVRMLQHYMASGGPPEPMVAARTKDRIISMLKVIQPICAYRYVDFREVLAHLSPVDDLIVALSIAAEKRGSGQ